MFKICALEFIIICYKQREHDLLQSSSCLVVMLYIGCCKKNVLFLLGIFIVIRYICLCSVLVVIQFTVEM